MSGTDGRGQVDGLQQSVGRGTVVALEVGKDREVVVDRRHSRAVRRVRQLRPLVGPHQRRHQRHGTHADGPAVVEERCGGRSGERDLMQADA